MADDIGDGKCFNCEAPCSRDTYCHGCKVYICDSCDVSCGNYGPGHEPEAHLQEPDDWD